MSSLVEETQRVSEDPDRLGLVWWLPTEFWEVSLVKGSAPSTPEQVAAVTSVVSDYTVFAVADGIVGQFGGMTWIGKEELRESILLQDADGKHFPPLPEEDVDPDAIVLCNMMKPVIAGMLGPMGQNMEFFFFPNTSTSGSPIADAKGTGTFRFKLGTDFYDWSLPLSSLLPEKICPVDDQRLNGTWKYCPLHGKKLEAKPN